MGTEGGLYALHILRPALERWPFRLDHPSLTTMYRFSIALLAVFMLAFSACVDTGEPEALDEADDADIIADDDGAPEPFENMFDDWDADGDTYVSMDEYNNGYRTGGTYATWDADGDGMLNETEYTDAYVTSGMGTADMYSTWDTDGDGMLSEDEIYAGSYAGYDLDGDGRLSASEFAAYEAAMGTGTM